MTDGRYDLETVAAAIRSSWTRESSDDPDEWTEDWVTRGQCGVSAYVIRALLGGDILIAPVTGAPKPGEHHAWNRLPNGEEVDLTLDQFRNGETVGEPWVGEIIGEDRAEQLLAVVRAKLESGSAVT